MHLLSNDIIYPQLTLSGPALFLYHKNGGGLIYRGISKLGGNSHEVLAMGRLKSFLFGGNCSHYMVKFA